MGWGWGAESEAKTSKADPGEDKWLPRPRAVEVSVRPLRPPLSASLSFQPIRENTGDKCPLQWTSSPRSPLPTMGRHVAGTRTGLSPPATSSSSFSFQLYNCIAKCQCTDCTRNVLWCQVHSSHIHSNHKTLNYSCIAIKLQLYCQVSIH